MLQKNRWKKKRFIMQANIKTNAINNVGMFQLSLWAFLKVCKFT